MKAPLPQEPVCVSCLNVCARARAFVCVGVSECVSVCVCGWVGVRYGRVGAYMSVRVCVRARDV